MSDETRTPAKSWNDKIREARAQARELRQKEINDALENDDVEEYERLMAAEDERLNGKRRAQLAGANAKIWADNEVAREWRKGNRGARRRNTGSWNLVPGAMVKLINNARVYTDGSWVMERIVPKGTLGILIDAAGGH